MSGVWEYKVKRVFIASPGDLAEEREAFPGILDHVNSIKAHGLGIHLEPLGWEDTLPGMGRPQELINDDVERSELVVMLLWKRWGTPSGQYSSGTEEEFELACKLREERGCPADIWLYFRHVSDEMMADPGEQLTKVLDFRKRIEAERKCLYKHYSSVDDWRQAVEKHLCGWLDRAGREMPVEETESGVPPEVEKRLEELEEELKQEKAARESAQKQLRRTALGLTMQAIEAVREGRPTEAEQYFATAYQTYPEPRVMDMYGVFLADRGDLAAAEDVFRRALSVDPQYAPAWSDLGIVLRKTGRTDEAERAYRRAIESDPEPAPAWFNLGLLLRDEGRADEAQDAFRQAAKIDPERAAAWHNLGVVLDEAGRYVEAEEAYRKAIRLEPEDADSWLNLATMLAEMGETAESEKAYLDGLALAPNDPDLHNNYAYSLIEWGRPDEAETHVAEALKIDPNHHYSYATLGLLELGRGNLEEGAKWYQKAIEIEPSDMALRRKYHYEYGRALARVRRKGEALKQFNAALAVDSDFVPDQDIKTEIEKLQS